MEIKDLIEDFIKEFSRNFLQEAANHADFDLSDRVYSNFWKQDMLKALQGHDFENFTLSCPNLANWFVRYGHALCEDPKRNHVRDSLKLCNPLQIFPPRPELLNAIKQTSPKRQLNKICDKLSQSKDWVFKKENFIENFRLLVEMEDVEILLNYFEIRQYDVQLTRNENLEFRGNIKPNLCGRNAADFVAPKIDEVVIIPKDLNFPFDAKLADCCLEMLLPNELKILKLPVVIVKEISESEVVLESNLKKQFSTTVDLIFRPTRSTIRYQYRSLALLAKNESMRCFLYPECSVEKPPPVFDCNNNFLKKQQLFNQRIYDNPEQLAAVSQIVYDRIALNAPFIIFGPPGTGKTTTIVEAILQLRLQHADSRILVTAGSNSACDTIALRICEYFKSSPAKLSENATAWPLLRIYSKSVVERGVEDLPVELRRQSNIDWLHGEHAYPAIEDIHRYGIIVATLSTVGKLVCGNVSSENFFTHIFIDEAGAASEPETLVGIVGIKNDIEDNCRVILSGDHKQLGPIIKSNQAVKLGLGKSLMQRLLERDCYAVQRNGRYDQSLQIRLRRNFRSHPEIVGLYNKLYYRHELIAMAAQNDALDKKWSFLRNPNFPIAFHAVCGEMSKQGTTSSCNMLEIQFVISYVALLLKADRVSQNDIGIITPYRLQSECIRNRLNEQNLRNVEVGSVENFQGREKSIVIVSMVRSKDGLGFVRNRKRLNVLLSRPKVLLLILGEPTTLCQFNDIKFIIDICKARGNYYDERNNTFGQMRMVGPLVELKTKQKKKSKTRKRSKKNAKKSELKALLETTCNITKNAKSATAPNSPNEPSKTRKSPRNFYQKNSAEKSLHAKGIEQSSSGISKENSICDATTVVPAKSLNSQLIASKPLKQPLSETKSKSLKI